jgi:hypothetical protein
MRAPLHLWVIGLFALAWSGAGALDYALVVMGRQSVLGPLSQAQLIDGGGFPVWAIGCWALAVFGALAGAALLLLRERMAIWAFVLSLAGITGVWIYQFLLAPDPVSRAMGPAGLWMSAVVALTGFGLLWYARAMKVRGVLT